MNLPKFTRISGLRWLIAGAVTLAANFNYWEIADARPTDNYYTTDAKELSEAEAIQYLYAMRTSTFARSYVFRFKIKHYPYRGKTISYYGTLYGEVDPIQGIQKERILIQDKNPENPRNFITLKDFLLIRGASPEAWIAINSANSPSSEDVSQPNQETPENLPLSIEALTQNALLQPILENITLTYFDLLAPYLYWREFEYLGPEQVKARPTQSFRLFSNATDSQIHAIELQLDDEFRAMLEARYLDSEGNEIKSMELIAFKKTSGTYIPKTIDYRDNTERGNKTRIDIVAAALEVNFPETLFSKENLGHELAGLDTFIFDVF